MNVVDSDDETREVGNRDVGVEPVGLTVYYDGACPLCRREIDFFRRRSNSNTVEWVDASLGFSASIAPDLRRADALARFHVRRADGRLESGPRGFAELWAITPGLRWLDRFARLPLAQPLLEWAYRGFLLVRPAAQRIVAAFDN